METTIQQINIENEEETIKQEKVDKEGSRRI